MAHLQDALCLCPSFLIRSGPFERLEQQAFCGAACPLFSLLFLNIFMGL